MEKFNSPAPEWSEVGVENGEYAGLTHIVIIMIRVVTAGHLVLGSRHALER